MSANDISTFVNTLNEKVESVKESLEEAKDRVVEEKGTASKNHEELIGCVEGVFSRLEKSIKEGSQGKIPDKTIPLTYFSHKLSLFKNLVHLSLFQKEL